MGVYNLRIRELPDHEKPRERLRAHGAGALADSELLAILLRVGVEGANAVQLGRTARWGLAAFGAAGAQRVIEILQQELVQVAAAAGCARLSDINRTTVNANFV